MSGTKIINVVKDDTFDEVFDLFKGTPSDEVVFILPKRSKVLNSEEQFQQVRSAADELGKKVSLLSANPDTIDLARQYQFEILQEKVPMPRKKSVRPLAGVAKVAVKKFDEESDDELIPDSTDAFDPHTPSDETMGIIEEKEEEKDVDEEEVLDDEALGKEEHLPADQADTGQEKEEPKDEPEDEIDEKQYQNSHEEFSQDDGELTRAQFRKRPIARAVPDRQEPRPTAANIKKGSMRAPDLDKIAEVWQHEPFDRGQAAWSQQKPEQPKKSSMAAFFAKKQELPRRSGRKYAVAGFLLLAAASGFAYVKIGNARIVITPFSKKLSFEMSANASDQFASVDGTFNKLPGQLFTVEKSATQEFAATGRREVAQKAKGKITIYNTYGTTPQTLIATTRFSTSGGLIFRTLRTVTVPGTTVVNGSITPGSVEVEVIADKAGSEYNVAPGRFTIPAFQEKGDTARYQKFYGQSTTAMRDGISGLSKVVTEDDFTKGKETVFQKLKEEIQEALDKEASGLKIPITSEITLISTDSTSQPDEAADTFTVTIRGSVRTMGFKESDMESLIKDYTLKNYGLTVLPEKLDIQYADVRLDEAKGILELTAKIEGNGYGQVQTAQITSDLMGKGETDIVGYLKQAEGVAEAKVLLSPFWVKKVPKNKDKVQIELQYE